MARAISSGVSRCPNGKSFTEMSENLLDYALMTSIEARNLVKRGLPAILKCWSGLADLSEHQGHCSSPLSRLAPMLTEAAALA